MNENIKFSIVIPTYNRANLIKTTIESVLQQDYSNFELIIVDDGSTDNTEELIKSISDNRINYLKKNNEERSVARNYGFNKAKGDYIVFFDSDDIMYPYHLSTLYENIVKLDFKVNFIACKYETLQNKKIIPSANKNLKESWYTIDAVLKGNIFGSQICIKKDNPKLCLFRSDQFIAEDWLFLVENLKNDSLFLINKTNFLLVDHNERSMRSVNNKIIIQQNLKAFDWITRNINLTDKQSNVLSSYIYYFCAIHSYLDSDKHNALKFLRKKNTFTFKDLVLFLKILIGYKTIQRISAILH